MRVVWTMVETCSPSSLTVESRLNFASVAGSTGPSLGSSHARFRESIISASVLECCGSLEQEEHFNTEIPKERRRKPQRYHVQIISQRALEEDAVLRHESQPSAEDVQPNVGDVYPVNFDLPLLHVDDPEERLEKRTLARTRPAHNADLLVALTVSSRRPPLNQHVAPTFSPGLTSKLTPLSTAGRPGRYAISTPLNSIAPASGHEGGGSLGVVAAPSLGNSV